MLKLNKLRIDSEDRFCFLYFLLHSFYFYLLKTMDSLPFDCFGEILQYLSIKDRFGAFYPLSRRMKYIAYTAPLVSVDMADNSSPFLSLIESLNKIALKSAKLKNPTEGFRSKVKTFLEVSSFKKIISLFPKTFSLSIRGAFLCVVHEISKLFPNITSF